MGFMKKIKAVCLFSGGLDSILAVKLIQNQGVEVFAIHFVSPFFGDKKGCQEKAKDLGVSLKIVDLGKELLKILRRPKHGFGKGANPCIDCHTLMLKEAKKYAKEIGAQFLVSGEVLGERPFSQNKNALTVIEREAGVSGILLRPLSAKLLPKTKPEKVGLVDREKLLSISGRRREEQLKLAKKFGIKDFPTPAGGCLLTEKEFATKVKDLLEHKKRIKPFGFKLLKIGRHFRCEGNKIIVGRNEEENKELLKLKDKSDFVFEVVKYPSPITLLQGPKNKRAIEMAARLTAYYSDFKGNQVKVGYGKKMKKQTSVSLPKKEEVEKLRIVP